MAFAGFDGAAPVPLARVPLDGASEPLSDFEGAHGDEGGETDADEEHALQTNVPSSCRSRGKNVTSFPQLTHSLRLALLIATEPSPVYCTVDLPRPNPTDSSALRRISWYSKPIPMS